MPNLGEMYQADCNAVVPASLNGNVTIRWLSENGDVKATESSSNDRISASLIFIALSETQVGRYICDVTVETQFADLPLIKSASIDIEPGTLLLNYSFVTYSSIVIDHCRRLLLFVSQSC